MNDYGNKPSPFAEPIGIQAIGSAPAGLPWLVTLDGGGGLAGRWNIITVREPSIFRLRCSPFDTEWAALLTAGAVASWTVDTRLRYTAQQPPTLGPLTDVPRFEFAQNGCCYLHTPGVWYVWNPNGGAGGGGTNPNIRLPGIVIPVPSDAAAERYLRGHLGTLKLYGPIALPAAAAGAVVLDLDFRRTAWTITNKSGKVALIGGQQPFVPPSGFVPLADGATMTCPPDMSPSSVVIAEAEVGAAVPNGLRIAADQL